jgi:hypothetical protein
VGACECSNALESSIKREAYLYLVEDLVASQERVCSNESILFIPVKLRPIAGRGLLILQVSGSHTATHHVW